MKRATEFVAMHMGRELVSTEMNWNEAIVAIVFTEERVSAGEVKGFLPGALPMVRSNYPHTGNDRNALIWLYDALFAAEIGPFYGSIAFQVGDRIMVPQWNERGDVEGGALYTVVVVRTEWTGRDDAWSQKMGYKNGRKQVGTKPNERAIWYSFKAPPVR